MVLNTEPLDWESSDLTTRPLKVHMLGSEIFETVNEGVMNYFMQ